MSCITDITALNCKDVINALLPSLPDDWREKLTCLVCEEILQVYNLECEDVRDCETVTSLSDFTFTDNQLSITYVDENDVSITRNITISAMLNDDPMDLIEPPSCVASVEDWINMSHSQKWQAVIDELCDSCEPTTTTEGYSYWYAVRVQCQGHQCEILNYPIYIVAFPISTPPTLGQIYQPLTPTGYYYYVKETAFWDGNPIIMLDDTAIDCEEWCCDCQTYSVDNQTGVDHNIVYTDCGNDVEQTVVVAPDGQTIEVCACLDSIIYVDDELLVVTLLEPACNTTTTTTTTSTSTTSTSTTTSSTTTTTTICPTTIVIDNNHETISVTGAEVNAISVDITFPVTAGQLKSGDASGFGIGSTLLVETGLVGQGFIRVEDTNANMLLLPLDGGGSYIFEGFDFECNETVLVSVEDCQCNQYTVLNETGGQINVQWYDCDGAADSELVDNLASAIFCACTDELITVPDVVGITITNNGACP
jgi:hypothetical protein